MLNPHRFQIFFAHESSHSPTAAPEAIGASSTGSARQRQRDAVPFRDEASVRAVPQRFFTSPKSHGFFVGKKMLQFLVWGLGKKWRSVVTLLRQQQQQQEMKTHKIFPADSQSLHTITIVLIIFVLCLISI